MDLVAAPGSGAVGARRGMPLFADVTVVSVHTRNGEARPTAATLDGGVMQQAVATKRRKNWSTQTLPPRLRCVGVQRAIAEC